MKTIRKLPVLLLCLILILPLTACGQNSGQSGNNIYIGSTVNILGEPSPINQVYHKGENSIELKPDGTGVFLLDGVPIDITYTLEGTDITMTADGMESVGTLEDGVLTFDFFGMDIEMVFVKS